MEPALLTRRLAELGHRPAAGANGIPVVRPESDEQAAELLGTCHREGWRVRLQGAGTRAPGAGVADLLVSAAALSGFDIYEPDDLTVGIRAGTTHVQAAGELARHQQLLTLDVPAEPGATLGGTFASGQAGPLRAGYGTPRDLALGTRLVTGDGRLLRLGGQVVKNVAGYDLVRLVVGSRGTLGLITQVHVRLRSLPPADVSLAGDVADAASGAATALRLRDAVAPVAAELLAPPVPGDAWRLAIRLHGSTDVIAAALPAIRQALPGAHALPGAQAEAFWRELAAGEAGAAVRIRCTALPSLLPELLDAASGMLELKSGNDLQGWNAAAHATEGGLRLWSDPPPDGAAQELRERLVELGTRVASVGGTCICDRGPASLRALLPGPEPGERVRSLERELRLRFDPGAILVGD